MKAITLKSEAFCRAEIERMLKNSQTKIIMPIIALALLRIHSKTKKKIFSDLEIRKAYQSAVSDLKVFLGHDIHIGAKYEDAYGMRMSRYSLLKTIDHLNYELMAPFTNHARTLSDWIPTRIKQHIDERLGIVPMLRDSKTRIALAEDKRSFVDLVSQQMDTTPVTFEIFSFAIMKVHLDKFACKIYRDTRTASHDKGVDLSTNFGVVYQIKRLRIYTETEADRIYAELKLNFDSERLQDGNVILVIDDISKAVKKYLIDMRVQSISKKDILRIAGNFEEPEDRQRVLSIVYEEFRREYSSRI